MRQDCDEDDDHAARYGCISPNAAPPPSCRHREHHVHTYLTCRWRRLSANSVISADCGVLMLWTSSIHSCRL